MTKEDIICMARKAQMPFYWRTGEITYLDKLERFAQLVTAAEREACAKVCYDLMLKENPYGRWEGMKWCMEAIRARGQQ